jgi:hypothetical protein
MAYVVVDFPPVRIIGIQIRRNKSIWLKLNKGINAYIQIYLQIYRR